LPTFARQKRCLTGLTLTNGQTSMHSVNLNMASRLLQSFRLAHLMEVLANGRRTGSKAMGFASALPILRATG